jgi:hypothetical protein
MYRKLVKLDPANGWCFSEVDMIEVRRAAAALKDYIERCIDPDDDPYEIRNQVLPLCEGALDGTLKLPLIFADRPLRYPSREGWLPESFEHYWSGFLVPATGSPKETTERVTIDGEQYAPTWFEEPGDWPHELEKLERERDAKWHRESKHTAEDIARILARRRERETMLKADEDQLAEKLRLKRARGGVG